MAEGDRTHGEHRCQQRQARHVVRGVGHAGWHHPRGHRCIEIDQACQRLARSAGRFWRWRGLRGDLGGTGTQTGCDSGGPGRRSGVEEGPRDMAVVAVRRSAGCTGGGADARRGGGTARVRRVAPVQLDARVRRCPRVGGCRYGGAVRRVLPARGGARTGLVGRNLGRRRAL